MAPARRSRTSAPGTAHADRLAGATARYQGGRWIVDQTPLQSVGADLHPARAPSEAQTDGFWLGPDPEAGRVRRVGDRDHPALRIRASKKTPAMMLETREPLPTLDGTLVSVTALVRGQPGKTMVLDARRRRRRQRTRRDRDRASPRHRRVDQTPRWRPPATWSACPAAVASPDDRGIYASRPGRRRTGSRYAFLGWLALPMLFYLVPLVRGVRLERARPGLPAAQRPEPAGGVSRPPAADPRHRRELGLERGDGAVPRQVASVPAGRGAAALEPVLGARAAVLRVLDQRSPWRRDRLGQPVRLLGIGAGGDCRGDATGRAPPKHPGVGHLPLRRRRLRRDPAPLPLGTAGRRAKPAADPRSSVAEARDWCHAVLPGGGGRPCRSTYFPGPADATAGSGSARCSVSWPAWC